MTADLRLSAETVAWVMAGYVLGAGALMIAGGRIAQATGYTRMMSLGLIAFGLASAVGGAAGAGRVLIGARVAQGVGAAVMTPAAMARLSAAFPGDDRGKAYGIFGMIMGSGTAVGLLLGGVLTQASGWRACMYVNLVFVAVSLALSASAGDRVEPSAGHGRGWWRGVALGAGVALIIRALTVADTPGAAAAFAIAGIAVVGLFAIRDQRAAIPMLPLPLFRSATRRVAYYGLSSGASRRSRPSWRQPSLQQEHDLAPLVVGALFLVYPGAIQLGLAGPAAAAAPCRRPGPSASGSP